MKADVRYVPSGENRSQGATLGDRLEPFCMGRAFATCSADVGRLPALTARSFLPPCGVPRVKAGPGAGSRLPLILSISTVSTAVRRPPETIAFVVAGAALAGGVMRRVRLGRAARLGVSCRRWPWPMEKTAPAARSRG